MSDLPSQLLPSSESPAEIQSDYALSGRVRHLRLLELVLVVFVAFAGSVALSIYAVVSGASLYSSSGASSSLNFISVIQQVAALAVLFYVLFRQGRGLSDLGFKFRWSDLPVSVGIVLLAILAEYIAWKLLSSSYARTSGKTLNNVQKNTEFVTSALTMGTLVLVLINPIFEELIVRAFLISEVSNLTGSSVIAVLASVVIQTTYHLYQGWVSALLYSALFLVFSLYYVRYRRIIPVILAHFYLDALAIVFYR